MFSEKALSGQDFGLRAWETLYTATLHQRCMPAQRLPWVLQVLQVLWALQVLWVLLGHPGLWASDNLALRRESGGIWRASGNLLPKW